MKIVSEIECSDTMLLVNPVIVLAAAWRTQVELGLRVHPGANAVLVDARPKGSNSATEIFVHSVSPWSL